MNQTLKGQAAIVTGASSGIGKAVALALAEAGADVLVNYHSGQEEGEEVRDEIIKMGRRSIAVGADVGKKEEVDEMFDTMLKEFGTIDILVNNAGFQKDASFLDMTLEDWQAVMDVNLTGQFLCAQRAAKEFVRRGVIKDRSVAAGKIICMSSVHELIPWAGHINYAVSKGGVMMLMKTLAQELGPHKIRVNSIAPGAIRTPINQDVWETKEGMKKLLELIPYGRIGTPEEIGKLAAWLASDQADYITGSTIFIDGGMTLYPGFSDNG